MMTKLTELKKNQANEKLLEEIKKIETNLKKIWKNTNNILSEIKPKIISLEVCENKIIAHLNNGQKPEVPLDWFAKWGVKNVNADKLKNYEIWQGRDIYFPELDEVLGIEKFLGGFNAPCE